jgi:single-strand DNA-binding protein
MAKSVNKVILLGNVGQDPEIRTLPSGGKVANLGLATGDRFRDKDGAWQERTEWHHLVAYARLAEVIEQYVKKGSRLYIEGRIETRTWDDTRSGEKKSQLQIKIEDLVLADGSANGRPAAAQSTSSSSAQQGRPQRGVQQDDWEDFR